MRILLLPVSAFCYWFVRCVLFYLGYNYDYCQLSLYSVGSVQNELHLKSFGKVRSCSDRQRRQNLCMKKWNDFYVQRMWLHMQILKRIWIGCHQLEIFFLYNMVLSRTKRHELKLIQNMWGECNIAFYLQVSIIMLRQLN